MSKIIKTYGAPGLIEWQCTIKTGQVSLVVNFSGGSLTGYGISPAKYSTKDAVVQRIIENSTYFKRGMIRLIHSVEEDGVAENVAPVADVAADVQPAEVAAAPKSLQRMEFASEGDAKQYLIDTFGITPRQIRSKKTLTEVGAANGIEIVIV